jgi:TRAP-type C4-dicarboxylate transport system permease small subunit
MHWLARIFAQLGGLVLVGLVLLTCLSIAGRSLNSALHGELLTSVAPGIATFLLNLGIGPINGDFELVEAGMAFSVFAFLPLCQLNGAHASVDLLTATFSQRFNTVLRAAIEVVFAAVLILIAWQLFQGTISKQNSGQTSLLLEFPVWWGYALSLVAAIAAAVIAVFVAAARVVESLTGQTILADATGAEH